MTTTSDTNIFTIELVSTVENMIAISRKDYETISNEFEKRYSRKINPQNITVQRNGRIEYLILHWTCEVFDNIDSDINKILAIIEHKHIAYHYIRVGNNPLDCCNQFYYNNNKYLQSLVLNN